MTTHFCAAIIRDQSNAGLVRDLVIDYQPESTNILHVPRIQVKYPGGKQESGETLYKAVCRETLHETGIVLPPLSYVLNIIHISIPGEDHIQHYYVIDWRDCTGELKVGPVREKKSVVDNRRFELVGNLQLMLHGRHREALKKSLVANEARISA
jgi:ADP-ribose pyrophosphatase YjhB (NUDIX family)